jgi:hypothetical protein
LGEPDLIFEMLGGRVILSEVGGVDGNKGLIISEGNEVGVSAATIFIVRASGSSREEHRSTGELVGFCEKRPLDGEGLTPDA